MVAIQNPSDVTGELQILDARYDIRNSENGKVPSFFISGYKGALPSMILNYPEESEGYVYGSGDGSMTAVSYASETATGNISGLPGPSTVSLSPRPGTMSSPVIKLLNM